MDEIINTIRPFINCDSENEVTDIFEQDDLGTNKVLSPSSDEYVLILLPFTIKEE